MLFSCGQLATVTLLARPWSW